MGDGNAILEDEESSPFGPFTATFFPSTVAVTPVGRSSGKAFQIRDIND